MTKGDDYELLVRELVAVLREHRDMQNYECCSGNTNRIEGKSGFRHQIDLSLENHESLFLLELKNYHRPVSVDAVLVIAARRLDIAAARPDKKLHTSLISTKDVTGGANMLADHFEVEIDRVESMTSYGLTFAKRHFRGVSERMGASDQFLPRVLDPSGNPIP